MADFRRNNRLNRDRMNCGNVRSGSGNSRLGRNNDRRRSSRELHGGECLTLRIEKMVQGGEGMARLEDGRVCFVAGALPGELCKVHLTFQKKDFSRGRVVEVIEPSPDRVKPLCPLYGKCGGCSLQHLASEKQAEYLEKVERENFRRLAHAELPEDFVIHTGDAWGYRNRARVVFRGNVGGCGGNSGGDTDSANRDGLANRSGSVNGARFGFRGEESNNIVPFENCPVLTDALNEFLRGPAAALISEGLAGGSKNASGRGDSRRLPRELDVNIFDNGKGEISFYYPGMRKSDFDDHAISVVEIAGRQIEADASVFFQSNLGLLPELVEAVRKAVDDGLASGKATNDWLIDLFSGVGFFACILQDKFKKITTVEREEGCLKHAKVNLSKPCEEIPASAGMTKCSSAGMTNSVENVSASAEDWLVENVVDVPATLIVDPPRTGLPKEALTAIVKSSVNRLIYVSCDPVTLARDYAKFTEDIQKPCVILLDELSRAPLSANNILLPCLDSRRELPVDIAGGNGMRNIKVHPDCVFIATANIGAEYTGTTQMDRALVDRFFMQEIEYMDADNEAKVLSKRCGIEVSDAKIIVETARTLRNLFSKGEISSTLSTRETLGAGRMVADGWSVLESMERCFLPFYEGTKTEGERGVVYKTFLRH